MSRNHHSLAVLALLAAIGCREEAGEDSNWIGYSVLRDVQAVRAMGLVSYAISGDGHVLQWGLNLAETADLKRGPTGLSWGSFDPPAYCVTPAKVLGISDVVQVACSGNAVLAVTGDRSVWAWGVNPGWMGPEGAYREPFRLASISDVRKVACADSQCYALKWDGTVWAWGANPNGELGNGTTVDSSTPVQVVGLSGATYIAANQDGGPGGGTHAMAVKADGTVWTWGCNNYGQLGDGTTTSSSSPVQAVIPKTIVMVCCSPQCSFALADTGEVYGWGSNNQANLGIGVEGGNYLTPQKVQTSTVFKYVSCNQYNAFGIEEPGGSVWVWGSQQVNLLPRDVWQYLVLTRLEGTSDIVALSAAEHVLCATADGVIWAWGRNDYGQLGNGTTVFGWERTLVLKEGD